MTRLKLLFSSIWSFIGPFVQIFLSQVGPVLAQAATAAVLEAERAYTGQGAGKGGEKRGYAYQVIVDELTRQGIQIGAQVTASMINAAIEAAVVRMQSFEAKGA